MSFGLRIQPVLTKDGRDLLYQDEWHTLRAVNSLGIAGASSKLGISVSTVNRRLKNLDERLGAKVCDHGKLTRLGLDLLKKMDLYTNRTEAQLDHLWQQPTLTCDGLVVQEGKVLLVRRGREPFKGRWALPGGIVEYGERTEDCVVREIEEETGLRTEVVRLVGAFSAPDRDPRGHFITLLYELKFLGGELKGGDDAEDAAFFPLNRLPPLAFDHSVLIERALSR